MSKIQNYYPFKVGDLVPFFQHLLNPLHKGWDLHEGMWILRAVTFTVYSKSSYALSISAADQWATGIPLGGNG